MQITTPTRCDSGTPDAHKPEEITDLEPEKKALELVKKYGLTLLETVPLKKI